jgi:hypothetical protein
MTLLLKFALIVSTVALIASVTLVAAIPVNAQAPSAYYKNYYDPSSILGSVKMHLIEAMKDMNSGNSSDALTQINIATEGVILAQTKVNASEICNNISNEGFCAAAPSP